MSMTYDECGITCRPCGDAGCDDCEPSTEAEALRAEAARADERAAESFDRMWTAVA